MSALTVLVAPDGHVRAAASGERDAAKIGRLHAAMEAADVTGWAVELMDVSQALGRFAEDCPRCLMPCGCTADDKLSRRCSHRLADSAPPGDAR